MSRTEHLFRPYDAARDREHAIRIWVECGWIEPAEAPQLDAMTENGPSWVAEVAGEAECLVATAPGSVRHLGEDLSLSLVAAVTTSRRVRRRGLAVQLTAHALQAVVEQGAQVAALGIFDQGFYDRLGFGTGHYEVWQAFDPARLRVGVKPRIPDRITVADYDDVHRARQARWRRHGACNITPASFTRMHMLDARTFGYGYRDAAGRITHMVWCAASNREFGPYVVRWLVYRNRVELLELLALIASWGDQVRLVKLAEHPAVQLEDLIRRPFRHRGITKGSDYATGGSAIAHWQMRLLDLHAALARTRLASDSIAFNLRLRDPLRAILPEGSGWRGISGDYRVVLGRESGAEDGHDDTLPTLEATVGAFTRLWLGVCPASGLAVTDRLKGPADLLARLDRVLCLPQPTPDWDF